MQRAIGRYLTREMAALGLVEAVFSFAAIYAVITLAGSSLSLPDFIEKTPHDHLALAAVLIPLRRGYRPDNRPLPHVYLP